MRGGERGRGERVYEARGCHATRPLGLGSGRGGAPRFVLLQVDLFFKKEKKKGKLHMQAQWGQAASGTLVVGGPVGASWTWTRDVAARHQNSDECAPTQQTPPEKFVAH